MVLSQRFVGCVGYKERGLRDLRLRHFDNPRLRNGAASVEALLYLLVDFICSGMCVLLKLNILF